MALFCCRANWKQTYCGSFLKFSSFRKQERCTICPRNSDIKTKTSFQTCKIFRTRTTRRCRFAFRLFCRRKQLLKWRSIISYFPTFFEQVFFKLHLIQKWVSVIQLYGHSFRVSEIRILHPNHVIPFTSNYKLKNAIQKVEKTFGHSSKKFDIFQWLHKRT